MTSTSRLAILSVLVVVAACNEALNAPEPAAVRLADEHAWAGGTARLISQGFADTAGIIVTLNGGAVTPVIENDSTLAIAMPELAGDLALEISGTSVELTQLTVHTHGFRSVRAGPPLAGFIEPHPGRFSHYFFGAGPGGLHTVNAMTGAVTATYPQSVHNPLCGRGPGPSYDTTALVLAPGDCSGPQRNVTFAPAPVLGDSGRPVFQHRVIGQPGPGVWLTAGGNVICVTGPAAPSCPAASNFGEDSWGARISPRGDRLAALMWVAPPSLTGAPIWNALTGAIAYQAPVGNVRGATFSLGGDTLFLVGGGAQTLLLALNATSGTELGRTLLPDQSYYYDLHLTADGKRLLAVVWNPAISIAVIRVADMTIETWLSMPSGTSCGACGGGEPRIIGDGLPFVHVIEATGFALDTASTTPPSRIVTFDLKP